MSIFASAFLTSLSFFRSLVSLRQISGNSLVLLELPSAKMARRNFLSLPAATPSQLTYRAIMLSSRGSFSVPSASSYI